MSELEDAWAAVHDVLPAGWVFYRPVHDDGHNRWTVVARDTRPRNSGMTRLRQSVSLRLIAFAASPSCSAVLELRARRGAAG